MKTTLCFILTLFTFLTLAFVPNSFAQDFRPIVRLIYFVPSDRQPQPDIDRKMDKLIKDVQQGYEGIMEAHGFGKKTFQFETDANENAVVHTVNGQHTEKHYNVPLNVERILKEIDEQFDSSKNFNLIAIDISSELLGGSSELLGGSGGIYGIGTDRGGSAGWVIMPASGPAFNIILAAHELGHAFGLIHDYRPDAKWIESDIVAFQHPFPATFCSGEWLDVHRAFNDGQPISNVEPTFDMLPPSFVSPPNVIRLRFKVTDHDGIHQVQLMAPEKDRTGAFLGCKKVNGNSSATVEFVTSSLTPQTGSVSLRMIDGHGNISWSGGYPIDFTSLLPPSEAISIPDPNLASAVREKLGLASGVPITQLDMLRLIYLVADERKITNLTGLEHATQLQDLYMVGNQIKDITPLSKLKNLRVLNIGGNRIKDITPLSKLKNLRELNIFQNQISDITPLRSLTNLRWLTMDGNPIIDITVLPSLKNLEVLGIGNNPISDIGPVWELTQLQQLSIRYIKVRDLSPLTNFTKLFSLQIDGNELDDISPLAGLTNLRNLYLRNNKITDISPLTDLVNLTVLGLERTPIQNRKPLRELLRKNPDVKIYLKWGGEPLPVTLSHFRAEHTDAGVILNWTTESEVDNAGFYIYRSEIKDGEFKVVNPQMIQGAGTTGERNEYTWADTTAKPNTVYYYRIEDVSHAGERKQLATVRLRGLVSASGKFTTLWAEIKDGK